MSAEISPHSIEITLGQAERLLTDLASAAIDTSEANNSDSAAEIIELDLFRDDIILGMAYDNDDTPEDMHPPESDGQNPQATTTQLAEGFDAPIKYRASLNKLADRAIAGDSYATEELMEHCNSLAKLIIARGGYYIPDGDSDDLCQSAMEVLLKSYSNFDSSKSTFMTFAALILKRAIITAVVTSNRHKRQVLNRALPFDAPSNPLERDSKSFEQFLPSSITGPDQSIVAKEDLMAFMSILSSNEKRCL